MRLTLCSLSLLILVACTRTGFNDDKFSFSQDEQGITITSDSISVRLTVYRDDIIQVTYFTGTPEIKEDESFLIILKPDTNIQFRIKENKEYLRLITGKVIAEVVKDSFNINFYDHKGQTLLPGSRSYQSDVHNKTAFFHIREKDHFYGMGQKSLPVDRKGYSFETYNVPVSAYTRPLTELNLNTPFVYSSAGWGVFFENGGHGYFDLGKSDPSEWFYSSKDGIYRYYFIQGDKYQDLLTKYYDLTGYLPMAPKWTLGALQSECALIKNNSKISDSSDIHHCSDIFHPGNLPGSWNNLKQQVQMLIGTSISGMPFISSDIITTSLPIKTEDEIPMQQELFIRWFEFSVLSPLLWTYGGIKESEDPYDELTGIITYSYHKLRYRLIPYLYSYMYRTSTTGEPLIKPLFFLFKDPKAVQYQDIQYMFGNEFLVAPVTEEDQVRKTIYLPELDEGYTWIDYWTDEPLAGGNEYSFKVPVQEIPLFIKQPAIIPMAKLKNYVGESPDDTLTIDIYPGGHAEFLLYEDDGISDDYKKGDYAITRLVTEMAGRDILVKIPATEGNYPRMVEERTWLLAVHLVKGFDEILVNGNKISPVEYVRALTRDSYYYDVNSYMLVLDVGGSTSEGISVRVKKCTLIQLD